MPPERLLKSTLLMAFYGVRSERLFCEQLDYNLLFRWFLDMDMVEESFDHSTFSKNRQRLLEHDVAKRFLAWQLIVDLRIDTANGFAERHGALALLDDHLPNSSGATLGADAGYATSDFIAALRQWAVTPHVAQTRDRRRRSAVDRRTTRHAGYGVSQRIRKRVEEIFGWAKSGACFRKTRFKGLARTQLAAHFVAAAYNLLRLSRLLPT